MSEFRLPEGILSSGPWKEAFDCSYSVKYVRLKDDSKSYPIFAPAYLSDKQQLLFLERQLEMIAIEINTISLDSVKRR